MVICRTFVGIRTGPFTLSPLSLAPRVRSAHTAQASLSAVDNTVQGLWCAAVCGTLGKLVKAWRSSQALLKDGYLRTLLEVLHIP